MPQYGPWKGHLSELVGNLAYPPRLRRYEKVALCVREGVEVFLGKLAKRNLIPVEEPPPQQCVGAVSENIHLSPPLAQVSRVEVVRSAGRCSGAAVPQRAVECLRFERGGTGA